MLDHISSAYPKTLLLLPHSPHLRTEDPGISSSGKQVDQSGRRPWEQFQQSL
jgi:hypothetical protein